MKHGITRRMNDLYEFLKTQEDSPVAPSYKDMAAALGLASTSGVHRLVHSLVDRGYAEILVGRKRTIKLKK